MNGMRITAGSTVTVAAGMALLLGGCGGGTGDTVIETGYLTCAASGASCGAGEVTCTAADGAADCVALPEVCGGTLSCACLGDVVCGEAACADSASGAALTCGGGGDHTGGDDTGGDDTGGDDTGGDDTGGDDTGGDDTGGDDTGGDDTGGDDTGGDDTGGDDTGGDTLWEPCADKVCGAFCTPCDPEDEACMLPGANLYCDASGACGYEEPDCGGGPPECCDPATKPLGGDEPPMCCADGGWYPNPGDGDPATCDPHGGMGQECEAPQPWEPCADKACGDLCTPCDPDDEACMLPGANLYCDAGGACVAGCDDDGACFPEHPEVLGCEAGPAIECSGAAATSFPEFDDPCGSAADCVKVLHQINCCGTFAALGIPAGQAAAFAEAEAICAAQYPGCGCASGPHQAEDGSAGYSLDDFDVVCEDHHCKTVSAAGGCASGANCTPGWYCDFQGDNCGGWGNLGACAPIPTACTTDETPTCACDGFAWSGPCAAASSGLDAMEYGGCDLAGTGTTFVCGDDLCDAATEYCSIATNDVAGPDQPEYYSHCAPIPAECDGDASCDCVYIDAWSSCWEGSTGFVIALYPGG